MPQTRSQEINASHQAIPATMAAQRSLNQDRGSGFLALVPRIGAHEHRPAHAADIATTIPRTPPTGCFRTAGLKTHRLGRPHTGLWGVL
jgi:hypothetical protein